MEESVFVMVVIFYLSGMLYRLDLTAFLTLVPSNEDTSNYRVITNRVTRLKNFYVD